MDQIHIRDPGGGSNQSGLRDQNARVVLSYIRRHGAMASAEIARRSGLSAQTVSNIVRALEADGLVSRGEAVKGRVGKPSVPMALNPNGVLSLGLNIGRRSIELVLVDFTGKEIDAEVKAYRYPATGDVLEFVAAEVPRILQRNGARRAQIAGIGVARPNQIWDWLEFVKGPKSAMQDWRDLDLEAELGELTGIESIMANDATSACVAEHLLGRGREFDDFGYFFVGTFVGGGLVLDGKVVSGRTHYAAAFGPLPVPDQTGGMVQLLDVASLHVLEDALEKLGVDGKCLRAEDYDWKDLEPALSDWIDGTARHLATACVTISSVVEVEAILVDGPFPAEVRARLTDEINRAYAKLDITGTRRPAIDAAIVGQRARSIGAALLPIHAKYFVT